MNKIEEGGSGSEEEGEHRPLKKQEIINQNYVSETSYRSGSNYQFEPLRISSVTMEPQVKIQTLLSDRKVQE